MSNNSSKTETKEVINDGNKVNVVKVTDVPVGEAPKTGDIVPINFAEITDPELQNLVQYYLNTDNPVFQMFDEVIKQNGKEVKVQVPRRIKYSYSFVDGKPFSEWIKTVNKDYQLDEINNQVVRPVNATEAKERAAEAEALKGRIEKALEENKKKA